MDLDVSQMIGEYEDIGATCISVLVDKRFAANLDLQEVSSVTKLLLCTRGLW